MGLEFIHTYIHTMFPEHCILTCKLSIVCVPIYLPVQALLQHCYNGTNYFTGKKGVEVDYLSFHLKARNVSPPLYTLY